ncbi:CDP-glycerol glycerophosphotransferase family protein [Neobacillus niacini]|uniref:CDP-glycerol glycerophosphotransferase family protein n=1 Tax=Neobacillus niacini TaxID=86668 RepID=UPI003983671D
MYKLFNFLSIRKTQILFASDSHSTLDGNFKFIYSEIKRQNLKVDCKFILKDSINQKKTIKEIFLLAYYMATSRFILIDDFYPMVYPLKIRKGADLIQVWHAVGAFKKFGFSRGKLPGSTIHSALYHKNYTKVIVSSKNVVEHYAEGFGVSSDKVIPIGVPRTDVFYDQMFKQTTAKDLYKRFSIPKDKKVILFAPTFRGEGQSTAYYPFEKLNFHLLYEKLKDDYIFLIKMHPFVKEKVEIPLKYKGFFLDVTTYPEINELLFITDLLITDYSSVCFEFALFNKPMLFFAFDLEEYKNERDFYYDYNSFIPGKLVRNSKEIVECINTELFLMEKIKPFVDYFYDYKDGNSSERFVEEVIKKYI